MRVNTKKLTTKLLTAHWTREQDIILIENNNLPIEQLSEMLKCSQEDIMARRKVLGLVTRNKQLVHMTPTEFRLLSVLVKNAGRVVTNPQLLREVWGPSNSENGHYLRIYMGHLRQKLEADPAQPQYLLTETAVGYRLLLPL